VAYCRSDAFRAAADGVAAGSRCEALIVDRERLAPQFRDVALPKVLDATDCMTLYLRRCIRWARGGERAVAAAELVKMPGYERRMGEGYRAVAVSSREDAAALRDLGAKSPVAVVPNGVDEDRSVQRRPEAGLIVMVGTMSYPPNVDGVLWFARSILPHVRATRPDVRLAVVGRDPTRAVRALSADPGIEVTGPVPDVTPWLDRATVLVAPMRIGGGFPNKVAEAMAAGVPVVATPAAYAGLDGAIPGRHVLSADTPEAFAQACLNVLRDPELASTLSDGGLDLARSLPRWADVARMLVDLLGDPGPSPQGPSKSEAS
jgi:glycosyltransferase involved in cell wall biosynthesis